MKTETTTIAFSGHRFNRIPTNIQQLTNDLDYIVNNLYFNGYRRFLTGMAEGFDMLAAEAVLRLKTIHADIKLIAVIPFSRQAYRYSEANKKRYAEIFKQCNESVLISDRYYTGCFHRRNDYLADNASYLITYFDGQPKGGTYYTVVRAIGNHVRMTNLFDCQQANEWWSGATNETKALFSGIHDGTAADYFWNRLHPSDRKRIYRYRQVRTGHVVMEEDNLNSLLIDIVCELAELTMEMEFKVSHDEMYDEDGNYYEEFQDRFNDLYDDIEARLVDNDFK